MRLLRRRRHRCPPCVSLRILINGGLVMGPITGEELAHIARFGGLEGGTTVDLLGEVLYSGDILDLQVLATYVPPGTPG